VQFGSPKVSKTEGEMVDGRILDCFFASLRGERERERVSLIATLLSGWDGRKKGDGMLIGYVN